MPLPSFSWANGAEVWNYMLEKDEAYARLRNERMLDRHPSLVDNYRTILLDWLSEVSHACKLHRETYHLALDFIDRYLTSQASVGKYQLQLIGVTCLFLAAKYEEIRPPTVLEFAELTDGACRPEEIIDNEVVILSAINWQITPMTPNSWLNTYMQILINLDEEAPENREQERPSPTKVAPAKKSPVDKEDAENKPLDRISNAQLKLNRSKSRSVQLSAAKKNDAFMLPAINGILRYSHKRIASLIDLALLHIESLRFSNSILTASALHHFTSANTARQCTGYTHEELADCIAWLEPFVETIREIEEQVFIASCKDDADATQKHTHIATANLLDKVITKIELANRQSFKRKACSLEEDVISDSDADSVKTPMSSPLKPSTTVLLTPPSSTRKSRRIR